MAGPLEKSVISPQLIGRAGQTAALGRALEAARAGQGQTLLIAGEAGVGKTRLAAETGAQAARLGFAVLQGTCLELDRSLPYGPLLEILRGSAALAPLQPPVAELVAAAPELSLLLPELALAGVPGPRPTPETDKYSLFHALERVLFQWANQVPLLLLVEDLHWSDDASLDFLLHLSTRLAGRRLLLLTTYRSEEAGPALSRFLLALNRSRLASELVLEPLTPDGVDAMLRAIFEQPQPVSADFLHSICQLTDGNPFFIEEILKSLVEAGGIFLRDGQWDRKPLEQLRIPQSVQVAVQQRLVRLETDARHLIVLAAVAGRRFSFGLLQALTKLEEALLLAHIKQLIAAQLIVEESADVYAFRHALTREAVYGTLLRRERQAYHRLIAQTIRQLHPGEVDQHYADLAYHCYHAGDWESVLTYAQQAGNQARSMYAQREAAELYSRAVEAAEHLGQAPVLELLRSRGLAYDTLGEFDLARADYEQGLWLAQAQADPRGEWQALIDLGFLWAAQDYVQAGDYFRRAQALAQTHHDPLLLAHSLNRLGNWHTNIDQPQAARQHHQAALAQFESLNNRQGRAETLDLLGINTTLAGDFVEGFGYCLQATRLFEDLDDLRGLASSLAVMGCCGANYMIDRAAAAPVTLTQAAGYAARSREIARQIGWRSGEAYALSVQSVCSGSMGYLGQALEQAQQALNVAAQIDHRQWQTFAHVVLGLAYSSVFALAPAQRHFEQALGLAQANNSPFWISLASSFLASVHIQRHAWAEAARLVPPAPPAPLSSLAQNLQTAVAAEMAAATGSPEAAGPGLARLLAASGSAGSTPAQPWQPAPRLHLLHGQVLAAQRRFAEAAASLETALRAAEAQGARPLQWQIHAALGHCWRARRKFEAADRSFEAAGQVIEALAGEIPEGSLRAGFREAALAQLPRRPGSPRRALKREFGGLTERERKVAALVGQGQSNRAIASALVLSERTVEKHVSNILGKLGLEKRSQIAAWAREAGLSQDLPD